MGICNKVGASTFLGKIGKIWAKIRQEWQKIGEKIGERWAKMITKWDIINVPRNVTKWGSGLYKYFFLNFRQKIL